MLVCNVICAIRNNTSEDWMSLNVDGLLVYCPCVFDLHTSRACSMLTFHPSPSRVDSKVPPVWPSIVPDEVRNALQEKYQSQVLFVVDTT